MIVLHIDSSPRGVDSVSRCLTGQIVDRLKAVEPTLDVVRYDLGDRPLPHLSSDAIGALRRAELATAEQREVGALFDRMIDELKRADLIVIGSPMHNFGISSHLKACFATIIRGGMGLQSRANGLAHAVSAIEQMLDGCVEQAA